MSDPEAVTLRDPIHYLGLALNEARKSPPKPSNFRVGACLVQVGREGQQEDRVLATGYTLECPGNTHAEQSCFAKFAAGLSDASKAVGDVDAGRSAGLEVEAQLGPLLPPHTVLVTTMEPCNKRSVGNEPCVERILCLRRPDARVAIDRVYVGVREPDTFVGVNQGRKRLEDAGVEVVHVPGLEEEILKVATAGHHQNDMR